MLSDRRIAQLRAERVISEVIGFETDEVVKTAHGDTVTAYGDRSYLDFTSGVAVAACGHGHPEIVQAIAGQAAAVTHIADVMRHGPQMELAERIRALIAQALPGQPPWTTLFLNSGSESVDAAVKLAIKATGRTKLAAFSGAFHGRTILGTTLSRSKRIHFACYEPFLGGLRVHVAHAPAPRCAACRLAWSEHCCARSLSNARRARPGLS
jgi:4-aminobutyrate aminotransferase-like enzyme